MFLQSQLVEKGSKGHKKLGLLRPVQPEQTPWKSHYPISCFSLCSQKHHLSLCRTVSKSRNSLVCFSLFPSCPPLDELDLAVGQECFLLINVPPALSTASLISVLKHLRNEWIRGAWGQRDPETQTFPMTIRNFWEEILEWCHNTQRGFVAGQQSASLPSDALCSRDHRKVDGDPAWTGPRSVVQSCL